MLLKMSILGGILIFGIIVIRSIAINKLPKKIFILLWDIVLLRLLIPCNLPFHYGIATSVDRIIDVNVKCLKFFGSPAVQGNIKGNTADSISSYVGKAGWAMAVWIIGMVIMFVFLGFFYFQEYQQIQSALPVSSKMENKIRSAVVIPKGIKLLVSDRISTPMAFGIFSPKIILPKILKYSDDIELKFILTHELVHIKRVDNFRKIIMLIAISVHWFNPFVWMMYIFFNRDIELACDEKVISLWGEDAKKEYAMTLVKLAEKQYDWSLFSTGLVKNAIHERIVAIMKIKKVTVTSIICALFLLGAALTIFASDVPLKDSIGTFRNQSREEVSVGIFAGTNEEETF